MKYTNKWLLALLPATLLTSCAEDVFEQYQVEEPASFAELKYLNNYNVLKDYASSASVKLGAEVDAAAYNNQGALFGVATTNFNEVSGGASLYHSSIVRDNGGVNIGNFADMVKKATEAGQSVFGSALLTNTANNVKYLKNIIADKVDPNYVPTKTEITKHDDTRCIRVQASAKVQDAWDNQFWFTFEDSPASGGESWEYTMEVRADKDASIGTQIHQGPGDYIHWQGIDNIDFTSEWTTITKSGKFSNSSDWGDNKSKVIKSIAFNLNDFPEANNYYFKKISFKIDGKEVIKNFDLQSDDVTAFVSKDQGKSDQHPSVIVDGYDYTVLDYAPMEIEVEYKKPCVVVHTQNMASQTWDSQFWIVTSEDFKPGDNYEVTMKIRADKEASAETQVHDGIGGYQHYAAIGIVGFTTEWTEYTASGTFANPFQSGGSKANAIAFNLNTFKEANNYYFASISVKINGKEMVTNVDLTGSDNSSFVAKEYPASSGTVCTILPNVKYTIQKNTPGIPLTAEEKYDTINYALNNYIKNMMEASEGKVTAWDVLCNVLSDDGSAIREVKEEKTDFNWSEYLGEEDFARLAVKYAREYFVAAGGNAADLKLFINESGLDNDAKLNGLKTWLGKWEADNTTKIDGISTSITAEFNENADAQKANEEKITKLFNSLKETGRLVRISGFNIKYIDASNVTLNAAAMTVDQGKKMGDFYKFIIKKYLEIIPANQRYGIFVSNITDNGDEPNGLWTGKYSRKPQYGGFAEGLQ